MKATLASPYSRMFEEFIDWFSTEEDCASTSPHSSIAVFSSRS